MVKKLITFPPVALALEMAHTYIRVGAHRGELSTQLTVGWLKILFP